MASEASGLQLTSKNIQNISKFIHRYLVNNKAKGKLAEAEFNTFFKKQKIKYPELNDFQLVSGVWIFSPKKKDFFKHRTAFIRYFPKNKQDQNQDPLRKAVLNLSNLIGKSGINSVIFKPKINYSDNMTIKFNIFISDNLKMIPKSETEVFTEDSWPRGKLRQVPKEYQNVWDSDIDNRFFSLAKSDPEEFLNLYIDECFLSEYLRENLKVNIADPYDTDGFIVKISEKKSTKIWPIELKEKSAAYDFPFFPHEYENSNDVTEHFYSKIANIDTLKVLNSKPNTDPDKIFFGLDGGRILMMLRICLPLNTDGIYIVRRMRNTRITLGDIMGDSRAKRLKRIRVNTLEDFDQESDITLLKTLQTITSNKILKNIEEIFDKKQVNISFSEVKGIGDKKSKELKKAGLNFIKDLKTIDSPLLLSILSGIDLGKMREEVRSFIKFKNIVKNDPLKFHFLEWRVTPLSSVLLGSSWNPIGGGIGMTGGATSTFVLTLEEFQNLGKSFKQILLDLDSYSLIESLTFKKEKKIN